MDGSGVLGVFGRSRDFGTSQRGASRAADDGGGRVALVWRWFGAAVVESESAGIFRSHSAAVYRFTAGGGSADSNPRPDFCRLRVRRPVRIWNSGRPSFDIDPPGALRENDEPLCGAGCL